MRWLAAFCFLFLFISATRSQQQETSLVDRLLRPNMELQNKSQNKKFTASSAAIERRGRAETFYLQPNRAEKSFADKRAYSAKQYTSSHFFNSGSQTVSLRQDRSANLSAPLVTPSARDIRAAYDSHNSISVRDYSDQRQFTERGKSQKSLDRQNPPLTIDQVRELLNKNK